MRVSAPPRSASPDLSFLVPTQMTPESQLPPGMSPPSPQERVIFFRSFATMFNAGIPVERALESLSEQVQSNGFRLLLSKMTNDILHGHSLTAVFGKAPEVFSSYHVRMIRVGEMTGNMDEALEQIALAEEKSMTLNLKLKSALTYPLWTMALAVLFLLFVPPYLMDGLFSAVEVTGTELPLITVLVNSLFVVLRHPVFQLFFAAGAIATVIYYPKIRRSERFKQVLTERALAIPFTRKLTECIITARFARAFSTMLEAGVPPALSLRLAAEEIGVSCHKEAGMQAWLSLENGADFPTAAKKIPNLRKYFHELLRAGEETGTMPELTKRAAVMSEEEVDHQVEVLGSLLEPMVMVFIGGFVGVLLIASMLPMLSVLQNL